MDTIRLSCHGVNKMDKQTILIGIAGASASGKSLLANTIVDELGSDRVAVISEDAYYKNHPDLSFEERAQLNYDHPDAFDHDLLCEHLHTLQMGGKIDVPIYNHADHLRANDTRPIGPHSIIVVEGIMLFVETALRQLFDFCIFVDTPVDICLVRRLKRDIKKRGRSFDCVIDQYMKTVRPMFLQFIEPSKRYADLIVPRGGANRVAIDFIKAKLRELLA